MTKKILIVEDEFVIAHDLETILEGLNYEVVGIALSEPEAMQYLQQHRPDMVLLDIQLKGEKTGIDIARVLNKHYHIPFVFISSFADKQTIARVKETNPLGYVLKPFDEREIYIAVELCLSKAENERLAVQNDYLNEEINRYHNFEDMVGESEVMQRIFHLIERVAPTDTTVLIQGETGTGKELLARAIHNRSRRQAQTMIKINCAALPSELIESELFGHEKGSFTGAIQKRIGKLELAHQSTIFLDEIGELPLASQAKLLRFLQEKEVEPLGSNRIRSVDVRVIAATNRNLSEEVAAQRFRSDLYFRLNVLPIEVPPLRTREQDVRLLARNFIQKISKKLGKPSYTFSSAAAKELMAYHWPGNVRELEHTIERAVLISEGSALTTLHLTAPSVAPDTSVFAPKSLNEVERNHIYATLQYCQGRIRGKSGAAELLNIHPNTLDARIKKLGIEKKFVVE